MTHPTDHKQPVSAGQFPALHNFLRGYFNQDMKDEYGSPADAARAFCQDASTVERSALSAEWAHFSGLVAGKSLDQINRILTGPLGSSYELADGDLEKISTILKDGPK
jgi:hypothetical protein